MNSSGYNEVKITITKNAQLILEIPPRYSSDLETIRYLSETVGKLSFQIVFRESWEQKPTKEDIEKLLSKRIKESKEDVFIINLITGERVKTYIPKKEKMIPRPKYKRDEKTRI